MLGLCLEGILVAFNFNLVLSFVISLGYLSIYIHGGGITWSNFGAGGRASILKPTRIIYSMFEEND